MDKKKALKDAGVEFVRGIGWAFPDPNTGRCWFDDSSYNRTVFLGTNADEAYDAMCDLNERK